MKFLSLLSLIVMLLAVSARASGYPIEMTPGKKGFDITAERLPNGHLRFAATFKYSSGTFEDYKLSLSVVQVHLTETTWKSSTDGLRRLPGEPRGQSIVCVFEVTPQELAIPNVSFAVIKPYKGEGFTTSATWFVPLAKVLPP